MSNPAVVSFESTCPNKHTVMLQYERRELSARISDKTIEFWCSTCNQSWEPSEAEQQRIQAWLGELGTISPLPLG